MLYSLKAARGLLLGIAGIAMLVLFITAFGCGGDKGADSKIIVRNPQKRVPVAIVTQPPALDSSVVVTAEPEEIVVSIPESPEEVTYEEAEAVFTDRNYTRSVELFAIYTERKSENPWGFYMLGLSSWKVGDHASAEGAFKRALELDPRHVKSQLNLSRVYLDTGRPHEALSGIDQALSIDPESNTAYRLQGRAFRELGENEAAIGAYRQAILLDEQDAWSMNNLGQVFIELERFDEALPPLARATQLDSDNAIFLNNLGMAFERTGHFRAAEETYRSATAIDESHEKASANLGRIEVVLEDPTLEPVDVASLAQSFVEEIRSWSDTMVVSESTESEELKTVVVSEETPEPTTGDDESSEDGQDE